MQFRLQVMEARVRHITGKAVRMEEADILGLWGANREAAMTALTSGAEFPLAIVNGVVACSGSLDIDAIAEAVSAQDA